jgi:hypothetical protein
MSVSANGSGSAMASAHVSREEVISSAKRWGLDMSGWEENRIQQIVDLLNAPIEFPKVKLSVDYGLPWLDAKSYVSYCTALRVGTQYSVKPDTRIMDQVWLCGCL